MVTKVSADISIVRKRLSAVFFVFLIICLPCLGQGVEIEPRRWSHLPINTNFAGAGYYHTEATIFFDPALEIENAIMEMEAISLKYIRTFEVFQKSARIDFIQDIQKGKWEGLVGGKPSSILRSGLTDSRLRFAINLYGAPPLEIKSFSSYRARTDVETIVGTSLAVHFPTGSYMSDKLINLGKNRFVFRPQLGVVHSRGKWSAEITGAVWLYADNNDFYNGNKLEQAPLLTIQSHLIYTFHPGFWVTGSVGYDIGAESKVNGVEINDRRENMAWALSLGFPITKQLGLKFIYLSTRTQREIGQDTDTFAAGLSFLW